MVRRLIMVIFRLYMKYLLSSLVSVGSQIQLSLRCNFSELCLEKQLHVSAHDSHLQVTLEYLRAYCKLYRAHNVEISTCLVSRCDKAQIKNPKTNHKLK